MMSETFNNKQAGEKEYVHKKKRVLNTLNELDMDTKRARQYTTTNDGKKECVKPIKEGDRVKIIYDVNVYRWFTPEFKKTRDYFEELKCRTGDDKYFVKGAGIKIPVPNNKFECSFTSNNDTFWDWQTGEKIQGKINLIKHLGQVTYSTIVCTVKKIKPENSPCKKILVCEPIEKDWGTPKANSKKGLRQDWPVEKLGPDCGITGVRFEVEIAAKGVSAITYHYPLLSLTPPLTISRVTGSLGRRRRLRVSRSQRTYGH